LDLIVEEVVRITQSSPDLQGETVLVTAGPTCEDLDPVRFLTNRSSGKMGYALAEAAVQRGAQTILVSGPTRLTPPPNVEFVAVRSAAEMRTAVLRRFGKASIVLKAAAVADFQPAAAASHKIKKTGKTIILELLPAPDILAELGQIKKQQILVGFAAETEQVRENALKKMKEKNLDLLVVNDITQEGAGFDGDTNIVTILDRTGEEVLLPKQSKANVAHAILDRVVALKRR
jgi:phosphopantothenoylcysteine decarboxylase/phosphopantothenate--cysteine ligase